MPGKQTILAALAASALPAHNMPDINIEPRMDDLAAQFEASLSQVAGTLHANASVELLQDKVNSLIAEGMQVLSLVDGVQGNRQLPATPHELKDIDFAVIEGELAVAENGAVWVPEQESHRVTPFICENLLLAVKQDALVANMHQAVSRLTLRSGSCGAFIAGPSKTADIEQSLVVGAHGACSLDVYLIR
ncbi:LutC/YkgG family protein [Shewanella sp. GXUN23E]|uniref:LutC/YkgG family protein n=1 Tax=Shewanella sp. GXUN23E TaxID=3422498 RepID=UPI003D7CA335